MSAFFLFHNFYIGVQCIFHSDILCWPALRGGDKMALSEKGKVKG